MDRIAIIISRGMRVLLLLLLLATGCARFQNVPLDSAASADNLASRTLTNSALEAFIRRVDPSIGTWPPSRWSLDQLTSVALFYRPDVKFARAQIPEFQGGVKTAAARPNPVLNLTPGYNTTTAVPSPWLPLTTLDVTWETAGKRRHRVRRAQMLEQAGLFHLLEVSWTVRTEVANAIILVEAAQMRLKISSHQLDLERRQNASIEQQMQAGAISAAETFPYRLALQRAQVETANATRALSEASHDLAAALGLPESGLQLATLPDLLTDIAPPSDPDENPRRYALQHRPEILKALAEYEAAQQALQFEISRQYPDIHLQPGYQFDQGENKWSLGLVIELPILNQNQGPIAEAEARRRQASANFEQVQLRALLQIDRAQKALKVSSTNALMLAQSRKIADALARSTREQFEAGSADQLALLTAEVETDNASLAELDAKTRVQQARVLLEAALQTPHSTSQLQKALAHAP